MQSDVVIIGGGLAGLSLGIQLLQQRADLRVVVVESAAFPVEESTHKVGESSVEIGAHYLSEVLGLGEHLRDNHLPKFGLRYFFGTDTNRLQDRIEFGPDDYFHVPSYQLDRGVLENELAEEAKRLGVDIVDGQRVRSVEKVGDEWKLGLSTGEFLSSRWCVDASGRAGLLSKRLALREVSPHRAHAAWWRVEASLDVEEWEGDPSWTGDFTGSRARRLSTNHFMGEGYWLWIIPLRNGKTSVGLVVEEGRVPFKSLVHFETCVEWLREQDPWLASKLEHHAPLDYGVLKQCGHGASRVFHKDGWALTGEAGVFTDPLYSPGTDFIAISNTLITDLIVQDRSARDLRRTVELYNTLYLQLYEHYVATYLDGYRLCNNALVMPVKVVWDFAVYWAFTAYFFCQDRFARPDLWARCGKQIQVIEKLSRDMQAAFRESDASTHALRGRGKVNIQGIEYLARLNESLAAPTSDEDFLAEFALRTLELERLALEIHEFLGQVNANSTMEAISVEGPLLAGFLKELQNAFAK